MYEKNIDDHHGNLRIKKSILKHGKEENFPFKKNIWNRTGMHVRAKKVCKEYSRKVQ